MDWQVLVSRLEKYLRLNKIINTSLQKRFLSGINGTFEHIFTITAILNNAKHYNLSVSLTLLDLEMLLVLCPIISRHLSL